MDQLLEKLVKSKAIMDKTENIKRGELRPTSLQQNLIEDFNIPQAKYNIPQELLQESEPQAPNYMTPKENTKPVGIPTVDAIKKSKLPDEIKRLMIEHPIAQAEQPQVTISNDLIEKASRLMRKQDDNNYIPESAKSKSTNVVKTQQIDYNLIQNMINEAVEKAIKNSGLLVESVEKTSDNFTFRVGKHIFEGKISKVKKLS